MLISEKKIEILKALSKYKYLTVSQIVDLGISPSIITMREYVRELKKHELIKQTAYRGIIQEGDKNKSVRFEGLNFLDKKGVDFLQKRFDMDDIKYPKSYKLSFSNDYIHRVLIVSTCISFEQWRQKNNIKGWFKVDFHKLETTIQINNIISIKPDIIIKFGQNAALVEIWAGLEKDYILKQIRKLIDNLKSEPVKKAVEYTTDRVPRILNIFKDTATMLRVKEEILLNPDFASAVNLGIFYFATTEQIKTNFNYWQTIKGTWIDIEKI